MQVQKFSTLPYTRPDYAAAQQKLRELTEQAVVKERNALTAICQPAYLLPTRQRQSCRRICTDEAEFV